MRSIVLIALLVNVVLFYWLGGQQAYRLAPEGADKEFVTDDVATIELLAELPDEQVVYLVDKPVISDALIEQAGTQESAAELSGVCLVVGPLLVAATVDRVVSDLREVKVPVGKWVERERDISGYWVYLPPRRNTRTTQRLRDELYGKRIESYIFTDGELKGSLSLGIFSSLEGAERRRESVVRKGYQPLLKVDERSWQTFWFEIPVEFQSNLAGNDDLDLALKEENVKISKKSCRVVATDK